MKATHPTEYTRHFTHAVRPEKNLSPAALDVLSERRR